MSLGDGAHVCVCVCVSASVCVAMPPGIGLLRQNVAGRQSGRVTEHIKAHTHMHTGCLLPPTAATHKYPRGSQPDAPTYWMPRWSHAREVNKGTERGVRGQVGTQKFFCFFGGRGKRKMMSLQECLMSK